MKREQQTHLNQRELRGLGIVAIGGQITKQNDKMFLVKSQSESEKTYQVCWEKTGKWKCDCQDYFKRSKPCKHVYAVNFLLNLPSLILLNSKTLEKSCCYCGSEKTVMKGFRYNKNGAVRLRYCKNCHKRFKDGETKENKWTNNTTLAVIAFDLHLKKVSLRDIKNHLWQVYYIKKPVSTLHRWITKLNKIMIKALSSYKLIVGDKWLADETILKVNGKMRYLWNIMDYETRIHVVSILTEGRGADEALRVIKEAIRITGKNPEKLVSDGLKSYSKAVSSLQNNQIMHINNVGLAHGEDNNNRIERLHGTIRSWSKPKRGLKSRTAELINVHQMYYNLVRPHMALKDETPIETGTDGRWLSFIVDKKSTPKDNSPNNNHQ